MDIMVYLGGLGLVLVLAMGLLLVLAQRQMSRSARPRTRRVVEPTRRGPRVQVVLPEVGESLVWVVEGRRYAHPDGVTEPGGRAALDAFLGQFRHVFPDGLPEAPLLPPVEAETGGESLGEEAETGAEAGEESETEPLEPTPIVGAATTPSAPPRAPLSYEEEMERPFFERLRSSFFGGETRRTASLPSAQLPQMPKLSDLDELMRERLALTPDLPATTVRIGSDGLLEFVVAGEVYQSISDIPHEGVRTVMREAVRIWESRLE